MRPGVETFSDRSELVIPLAGPSWLYLQTGTNPERDKLWTQILNISDQSTLSCPLAASEQRMLDKAL